MDNLTTLAIAAVTLATLYMMLNPIIEWVSAKYITAEVIWKERVKYGSSSLYLIYTDKETFKNTDSYAYWKFNSSDLYGKIEVGRRYKFLVVGFRVPYFSAYRNLIKITRDGSQ